MPTSCAESSSESAFVNFHPVQGGLSSDAAAAVSNERTHTPVSNPKNTHCFAELGSGVTIHLICRWLPMWDEYLFMLILQEKSLTQPSRNSTARWESNIHTHGCVWFNHNSAHIH